MAKTSSSVIAMAKSQVGTKSVRNKCKYNTEYYGKAVSGNAYPWCCVFVWWIFKHCGASSLFYNGKKTAYVPAVRQWGISNKLTVNRKNAKLGDVVIFDWDGKQKSAHHVGFILGKKDSNTYYTIEGNTGASSNSNGGKVMIRERNIKWISFIIRPKYEKEKASSKYNLKRALVKGCTGSDVKKLQKLLGINADGSFGPNTLKAVKKWQKKKGLVADGSFGPKSAHKAGWLFCGK